MLKEVKNLRQTAQSQRRWFNDDYFDLIVWDDNKNGNIANERKLDFLGCVYWQLPHKKY